MDKDHKDRHEVSDHDDGEPFEEAEKMRRSSSGSYEVEAELMNDDEVSAQDTAPAATHKCNLCGKTFINGKALGGHRRSHFQAAKKKKNHPQKVKTRFSNHSKEDSNYNRASCDDDNDGKKLTCYLCNKKFPSKNALYGHMRSHPERVCRGVFPPTPHSHEHNHSSSSHNSDSSMEQNKEDPDDACVGRVVAPNGHKAIDLSKSTSPSWLKTDKRGRKCIGSYEAAKNLVYLCAGYFCAESTKKGAVEPKSPEVPMPSKKRKIGESSTGEEHVVNKIKFFFSGSVKLGKKSDGGVGDFVCDEKLNRDKDLSESGVEKISVEEEEDGWGRKEHSGKDVNESSDKMNTEVNPGIRLQDHLGHFEERKVRKVKKGKKIKKTKESTFANGTPERLGGYRCGICGKSFSTFQGLGGHRSIHKDKNCITMDQSKHYSDAPVAEENNSYSSSDVPKVEETPLSEEETLADETSQSTGPKKMNFDLNEPYVMED